MISSYVEMNQMVCANHSIPYINMHHSFLAALPSNYYGFSGCITLDGEHPNNNGAIIVAKMFSEYILGLITK